MSQDRGVPAHVVVRCTSCGLRYPTPVDDARRGTCPACEGSTADIEPMPTAFVPSEPDAATGATVGVLDNIRSALNVGTMLRAADGARIEHMHLCGLTPAGDHPKVRKTALGAEDLVPWTHHLDAVSCVEALQSSGWAIWAIESTSRATALDQVAPADVPSRVAVVVGNERAGVDPGVLRRADRHVHLPMAGAKTSLNVGVAFGIAAYAVRWLRAAAVSEADAPQPEPRR